MATTWTADALTKGTATTATVDGRYTTWVTSVWFYNNGPDTVFLPIQSDAGGEDTGPDRTENTGDTCDFEIYKAISGVHAEDTDQHKLSSTVSVEDGTAHTTVTASFGTNYSFLAGNVIGIKMTFENSVGDVEMAIVWRILAD